ncbi:MAG: hypothetical protein PHG30_07370 [Eubacteriales bacterium]|nr:hypothetical protein [Eubacteriales bacterium]MDD4286486.1 hypothetical protein [Eubacteriales bacterium]HPF18480.1 hypothetical protein [Bacillota bacterium]
MKRKTVLGLFLMIFSLGVMVFWEVRGRDALLLTPVLAASRDIAAGESVLAQDLTTIHVLPENRMTGALMPESSTQVVGCIAVIPLCANQQLSSGCFRSERNTVKHNQSIFPICEQWIGAMSSVVRPGDAVRLFSVSTEQDMGIHRVAYVIDRGGRSLPVFDSGSVDLLERHEDADPAASLEIVCTAEEYMKIYQSQHSAVPGDLIVYMEGGL